MISFPEQYNAVHTGLMSQSSCKLILDMQLNVWQWKHVAKLEMACILKLLWRWSWSLINVYMITPAVPFSWMAVALRRMTAYSLTGSRKNMRKSYSHLYRRYLIPVCAPQMKSIWCICNVGGLGRVYARDCNAVELTNCAFLQFLRGEDYESTQQRKREGGGRDREREHESPRKRPSLLGNHFTQCMQQFAKCRVLGSQSSKLPSLLFCFRVSTQKSREQKHPFHLWY